MKLFKEPVFYKVLINTVYYTCGTLSLMVVVPLIAAVLLNSKLPGSKVFGVIYYIPAVIVGVPMALLFSWFYNPTHGLFNYFLSSIGIRGPNWLWDENWAMPALILMSLWRIGPNMIIFLAGLQALPQPLYEAARIDGANFWQRFVYLTLPMMSPVIFLVIILSTFGSFQAFVQPYVMTGGGPANATLLGVLYLYYSGFEWGKMGYASAIAWVLLVILLIFTVIQLKLARHWVYYEVKGKK